MATQGQCSGDHSNAGLEDSLSDSSSGAQAGSQDSELAQPPSRAEGHNQEADHDQSVVQMQALHAGPMSHADPSGHADTMSQEGHISSSHASSASSGSDARRDAILDDACGEEEVGSIDHAAGQDAVIAAAVEVDPHHEAAAPPLYPGNPVLHIFTAPLC